MKKYVNYFMDEYQNIQSMESFNEHNKYRYFLWKNGLLLSITGILAFLFIGVIFTLLNNKSYVFYGLNMVFIIGSLLLIYSLELRRQYDLKISYQAWVPTLYKFLNLMDVMVVFWGALFYVFQIHFLSGLEGTIFNIVIILYIVCSFLLRRKIDGFLHAIPVLLIGGGVLLFLETLPVLFQYGLMISTVTIFLVLKKDIGDVFYKTNKGKIMFVAGAFIITVLLLVKDNDVVTDGVDVKNDMRLSVYEDANVNDKDIILQYGDYIYVKNKTHVYQLEIYNNQFELLETYTFDQENYGVRINYNNHNIMVFYSIDDTNQMLLYEINQDKIIDEIGVMTREEIYTRSNIEPSSLGTIIYMNDQYKIVNTENDIYKIYDHTKDNTYLGQLDEVYVVNQIHQSSQSIVQLFMINDLFIFSRPQNDEILIYLTTINGDIVGGFHKEERYRGSETLFYGVNNYSRRNPLKAIYYDEHGQPYIVSGTSYNIDTDDVHKVDNLYYDNFMITWKMKNRLEVSLLLILIGISLPLYKKEGE